jgi:hypothetical protein
VLVSGSCLIPNDPYDQFLLAWHLHSGRVCGMRVAHGALSSHGSEVVQCSAAGHDGIITVLYRELCFSRRDAACQELNLEDEWGFECAGF